MEDFLMLEVKLYWKTSRMIKCRKQTEIRMKNVMWVNEVKCKKEQKKTENYNELFLETRINY